VLDLTEDQTEQVHLPDQVDHAGRVKMVLSIFYLDLTHIMASYLYGMEEVVA
jgi:hypothetical protein